MTKKTNTSRRNFLKVAAVSTAGITLLNTESVLGKTSGWPTTGKMEINPNISNLRVVCCYDTRMIKSTPTSWSFDKQNAAINTEIVQNNLDEMAKTLAQKSTAKEAWATIFRKPAAKAWADVKVAMKVNCIEPPLMHRLATIDKVCKELINLGVDAKNIIIYDGCHNAFESNPSATYPKYNSAASKAMLPAGVLVSDGNSLMGGQTATAVPGNNAVTSEKCSTNISNGTIDILVNCCVNKGHGDQYGSATLSMKNHGGTFVPSKGLHQSNDESLKFLLGINKSDAILGGTPPRQQLIICDSLFASDRGPTGTTSRNISRLVMGTFGPVLDYLVIKKIRGTAMNVSLNATASAAVNKFLTEFGYTTADVTDFVNVNPVSIHDLEKNLQANNSTVLFNTTSARFHQAAIEFKLDKSESIQNISIHTVQGKQIYQLNPSDSRIIHWDGKSNTGSMVAAGTYIVKITTNKTSYADRLSLVMR